MFFGNVPSHVRVAASNWIARACTILIQLISIPLLTRSLGAEQFAVYAVTISLISWYMLFDPGIGNAVQNFISESNAISSDSDAHIANGLVIAFASILIGASALLLLAPYLATLLFSRIATLTQTSVTSLLLVSGVLLLSAVIGNVCTKILYALGRGITANVIALSTNIVSFLALLFSLLFLPKEAWLFTAVLAYAAPMGIAGLVIAMWLFFRIPPRKRRLDYPLMWQICRRGAGFWFVSAIGALVFNLDYIILAQSATATEISEYNILQKVFGTAMTFYSGLLSASWPYWSQSMAQGKISAVLKSMRQYLLYGMAAIAVLTASLTIFREYLFELLLPQSRLSATSITVALFGMFIASRIWIDTYSTLLLATNDTKFIIYFAPVQAVLSIALQLWLTRFYGLNGILLALIISAVLTAVWLLPLRVHRNLRNS